MRLRCQRLVLGLASLTLSLAALELLLRMFGVSPSRGIHFAVKLDFYRLDPDLIWSFVPNAHATWGTDEFTETTFINSLGLRGPEVPPQRGGERSILTLGDSFTYGHGVRQTETYPAVLEALLRRDGWRVVVLNAGVPGYSMDQSYRGFLLRWRRLRPGLVIVGVTAGDVLYDSDKSLYDVRDGTLVPLDARRNSIYLQGLLYRAAPPPVRRLKLFRWLAASLGALDPLGQVARRPGDELVAWMRRKVELELTQIDRISERMIVVLVPCRSDVRNACEAAFAELVPWLRTAGIVFLDGDAALDARGGDPDRLFYVKDLHMNAEGNRVLASAVAELIVREQLLERHPPG